MPTSADVVGKTFRENLNPRYHVMGGISYRRLSMVFTDSIGFFLLILVATGIPVYYKRPRPNFQFFLEPYRYEKNLPKILILSLHAFILSARLAPFIATSPYGWQIVPCHNIDYTLKFPLSVSVAHWNCSPSGLVYLFIGIAISNK